MDIGHMDLNLAFSKSIQNLKVTVCIVWQLESNNQILSTS